MTITSGVYATDGTHLLAWDATNGGGYTPIVAFAEPVADIAFAPDGSLWGVYGTQLLKLDASTGQVLERHDTNQVLPLTGIAFSPDGRLFVTADFDGGAMEFDTTGKEDRSFGLFTASGDRRDSGTAYGDAVVFNGDLWVLTFLPIPGNRIEYRLESWNLATGLLNKSVVLVDPGLVNPRAPGLAGVPLDALGGLAISEDGHLYLTGPGPGGTGAAIYRIDFWRALDFDPFSPITVRPVLVEETSAFASLEGAAGAEDSRVAWTIGTHELDVMVAWSTTTPARMHGHEGNDTLTAGALDDEVFGDAGHDQLYGLGGTDDLYGGDGNDTLSGEADSDVLQGGLGNDSLVGGDGSDILGDDGIGNDTILGGAGNDAILAEAGDDQARGEAGADQMHGGDGNDQLDGGADGDILRGETGNDTLLGAEGHDELLGQDGQDQVLGGTGNDRGWGGAAGDTLRGEAGIDLLGGEAGDDWLAGGAGADTLTGGTGADRFRFENLSDYYIAPTPFGPPVLNRYTPDVITDFVAAQADRIDLAVLFDSFGATAAALTTAQLRAQGYLQVTQSGADALVRVDSNGATGGASFLTVAVVQATQAAALADSVFLT